MTGPDWPLNHTARYDRAGWTGGADPVARRYLRVLLVVHDMITYEGAAAAGELLTGYEIDRAVVACRYFGLDAVGDLLIRLTEAAASPVFAALIDAKYRERLPDDAPLLAALRRKQAQAPQHVTRESA